MGLNHNPKKKRQFLHQHLQLESKTFRIFLEWSNISETFGQGRAIYLPHSPPLWESVVISKSPEPQKSTKYMGIVPR